MLDFDPVSDGLSVIGDGLAVRVGLTVEDVKARRRGQLASSRRHTALKTGTLREPPSPRWSP
jgi:hypothetical protein